jgi:hypothetical protein
LTLTVELHLNGVDASLINDPNLIVESLRIVQNRDVEFEIRNAA